MTSPFPLSDHFNPSARISRDTVRDAVEQLAWRWFRDHGAVPGRHNKAFRAAVGQLRAAVKDHNGRTL